MPLHLLVVCGVLVIVLVAFKSPVVLSQVCFVVCAVVCVGLLPMHCPTLFCPTALPSVPHAPMYHSISLQCTAHTDCTAPPCPVPQAFMYHTISLYGDAEGWNIAFYVFTALRSLLFFVVIILLATGKKEGGQKHECGGRGRTALPALLCGRQPAIPP